MTTFIDFIALNPPAETRACPPTLCTQWNDPGHIPAVGLITPEPVQSSAMIAKRVATLPRRQTAWLITCGVKSAKRKRANCATSATPLHLALRYNEQGADEMVFFDITASAHGRVTMVDVIERAADQCLLCLSPSVEASNPWRTWTPCSRRCRQNQHQLQRARQPGFDPRRR